MRGFRHFCKALVLPMAAVVLMASLPVNLARAGLVGTDRVLDEAALADRDAERGRVMDFLAREDVRRQIQDLGVDPDEAAARVGSLSDAEVQKIAGVIDKDPAGQGAVGAIVGAAVFIFVVLLVTDLLGLTDVFPFVRSQR